jgi:hypothetical protein
MVKFNIILILFYLLTAFSFQKEFEYDYEDGKGKIFALDGQNFVTIKNINLSKKYLKIITMPKYDISNTATILFFKKKTDKREEALLFGDDKIGDNFLFISKDLFDDSVYLNVSCFKEDTCSYQLRFDETEHIQLKRDGIYSYQTNKGNTKNTFIVSRKNEDSKSGNVDDEKAIMTFFVNNRYFSFKYEC